MWQCRLWGVMAEEWEAVGVGMAGHLEEGYSGGPTHGSFSVGFTMFEVDYDARKLLNSSTNSLFEIRRVAFAPLMPMEVTLPPPPSPFLSVTVAK